MSKTQPSFRHLMYLSTAAAALSMAAVPVLAQEAPAQSAQPVQTVPAPTTQPQSAQAQTAQPQSAQAQPAPAATDAEPVPVTTVTVTGVRSNNRIDRQAYDMKDDPEVAAGTAADALTKLPSVSVDAEGNVSLRGNSNVQILIDGKPSAMMQGENRNATILSMAGDDIDSVEVINNPGAQFSSEGSGGMINIVMKRNRRPGGNGQIFGGIGNQGRYNAGITGSYNKGRVTLSGGLNTRHDERENESSTVRDIYNPFTDTASRSVTTGTGKGTNDNIGGNANIEFNISEADSLSAGVNFNQGENENRSSSRTVDTDADGNVTRDYTRNSFSTGDRQNNGLRLRMDHAGDQDGETFKVNARLSNSMSESSSYFTTLYALAASPLDVDVANRQNRKTRSTDMGLGFDYERNIGDGRFTGGAEFETDTDSFDNYYAAIDMNSGAETVDATRSNRFSVTEHELSVYGQYQRPIGEKWAVMGGLRLENTETYINQLTLGTRDLNSHFQVSPSFFLSYSISDVSRLRLSYSHRTQRPRGEELNPFIVYRDEQNVSSGNPNLKPQQTDAIELGFESRFRELNYALRGYYRQSSDIITQYSYFISPDVLLTTRRNAGEGKSGGLEFTFNGKLTEKLSINANGNLGYYEQPRLSNSGEITNDTLSATSLSGRAQLDYRLTTKDRFMFTVWGRGRQLMGQGYMDPIGSVNLSYTRNLTPRLSLTASANDVFNSMQFNRVIETETLREVSENRMNGRTFYINLRYTLGGNAGRQPQEGGDWRGRGGGGWGGPGF